MVAPLKLTILPVFLSAIGLASAEHGNPRMTTAKTHRGIAERINARSDSNLLNVNSGARFTFYDVGLGACGQRNVESDFIVALNSIQFGDGYPGPNCFKTITMKYKGKSAKAKIMDMCPGCPYGGLDLSRGLFRYFASEGEGVIYGEWHYGTDPESPQPAVTSHRDPPAPFTSPTSHKVDKPIPTPMPTHARPPENVHPAIEPSRSWTPNTPSPTYRVVNLPSYWPMPEGLKIQKPHPSPSTPQRSPLSYPTLPQATSSTDHDTKNDPTSTINGTGITIPTAAVTNSTSSPNFKNATAVPNKIDTVDIEPSKNLVMLNDIFGRLGEFIVYAIVSHGDGENLRVR